LSTVRTVGGRHLSRGAALNDGRSQGIEIRCDSATV